VSELTGRSVDTVRRTIATRLRSAGLASPELDARTLIGTALQLDHTGLAVQAERTIEHGEADLIDTFVARRLAGEPVARIVGCKEFWGREFLVTKATLVPRPDTETVVAAALDFFRDRRKITGAVRIADIGTGTGAILLSLLAEIPEAIGVGTDISAEALSIATANAERLGLADRAKFMLSDYASGLSGQFDLVVSNPPYIRSSDIEKLETDVRGYDPLIALDGGMDGLDAYRAIAPQAVRLLLPGGGLIVEVGHDQAALVSQILAQSGLFPEASPRTDLAGIPRVVTAQKPVN